MPSSYSNFYFLFSRFSHYSVGKLEGGPPFLDWTRDMVGKAKPVIFNGKWNNVANSSVFKIGHSFVLFGKSGGNLNV